MSDKLIKFIVGKTYTDRSACDHETVFKFEITHRTSQTITFLYHGKEQTRRVSVYDGSETAKPLGSYSMAPVIRATEHSDDAVEAMKADAKKVQVGVVDVTPAWVSMVPVFVTILRDGTSYETRQSVEVELRRMADLADRYVALVKAGKVEGVQHK
jgi:hypothetical protein